MSIFFALPDALSLDLLLKWCGAQDLMVLDTATCNKIHRRNLLGIFSSPLFVLEDFVFDDLHWYCRWIVQRDIKLRDLELLDVSKVPAKINKTKIEHFSFKVNFYVGISSITASDLINFINQCPNLKSVEFYNVSTICDEVLKKIEVDILKQLSSFSCEGEHNTTQSTLDYLHEHLNGLENFAFDTHSDEGVTNYLSIMKKNKKLKSISIYSNSSALNYEMIIEFCRHGSNLTSITILCPTFLSCGIVNEIFAYCPKLLRLDTTGILEGAHICVMKHEIKTLEIYYRFVDDNSTEKNKFYETLIEYLQTKTDFQKLVLEVELSDVILTAIGINNPSLTDLVLIDNKGNWSSQALKQMLRKCNKISSISLKNCLHFTEYDFSDMFSPIVTDETLPIKVNIGQFSSLRHVHMEQCDQLTAEAIIRILQYNPQLLSFTAERCMLVDRCHIVDCIDLFDIKTLVKLLCCDNYEQDSDSEGYALGISINDATGSVGGIDYYNNSNSDDDNSMDEFNAQPAREAIVSAQFQAAYDESEAEALD